MKFIVKEARKIVVIFLVLFLLSYFFTSFSLPFLLIFILVLFLFFDPEREITIDENVLVSPADITIKEIKVDENAKNIHLICKKTIFNNGVLRAIMDCSELNVISKKGLINSKDDNSKHTILDYQNGIIVILKNGFFTNNIIIRKSLDLLQGERIGFMFDGDIEIILPYDARLLIGLGDKILANTQIARLGE